MPENVRKGGERWRNEVERAVKGEQNKSIVSALTADEKLTGIQDKTCRKD